MHGLITKVLFLWWDTVSIIETLCIYFHQRSSDWNHHNKWVLPLQDLNFKPLIFQNIYQLWIFYRIATYFRQWTKLQIIRSTRLCIFVKIDALIIDMIKCIPVYKLYWNSVEQNVSGKYSQIVVRGKIINVTFLSNNVNRIVKNGY